MAVKPVNGSPAPAAPRVDAKCIRCPYCASARSLGAAPAHLLAHAAYAAAHVEGHA